MLNVKEVTDVSTVQHSFKKVLTFKTIKNGVSCIFFVVNYDQLKAIVEVGRIKTPREIVNRIVHLFQHRSHFTGKCIN